MNDSSRFNKKAFEQLFNKHYEKIVAYIYSYVQNEEVAKDILHDTFLALWEKRTLIDTASSPKALLYKMAQNYAFDYLRHQKVIKRHEYFTNSSIQDITEEFEEFEESIKIMNLYIDALPEKQREVLQKAFVAGKSYKVIAEELEISVNTVKTHLKRALDYLRTSLKEKVILLLLLRKNKK